MNRWAGYVLAVTMVASPAAAEETAPLGSANGVGAWGADEVDVSYEASRARLIAAGYSEVEQVNGSPLHLKALDRDGSAVRLSIDPQSGEVDAVR